MAKLKKGKNTKGKEKQVSKRNVKAPEKLPEPHEYPLLYKHASYDIIPDGEHSFEGQARLRNDRNTSRLLTTYYEYLKNKNFHFNEDGFTEDMKAEKKKSAKLKGGNKAKKKSKKANG